MGHAGDRWALTIRAAIVSFVALAFVAMPAGAIASGVGGGSRFGFALRGALGPFVQGRGVGSAGPMRRAPFHLKGAPLSPFAGTSTSIEPYAPPAVPVGVFPSGIAVNQATHTVYVVNSADDTVSVIDGNACNAAHPAGCSGPLATITLGPGGLENAPLAPTSLIVSPDGRTLYVTSPDGENALAVIDASHCNATGTAGCGSGPLATVATGQGPLDLAEDPATDTVYVANIADDTVSVIDGTRCNAQQTAGCGKSPPTVSVGNAPVALAVDPLLIASTSPTPATTRSR